MNNYIIAFIITLIAGLSTLMGYFIIYIKKPINTIISISLSFAAGIMLSISILDLIPNSFILIKNNYSCIHTLFLILIGILGGILISNVIDNKLDKTSKNDLKLYKIGIITMSVIILHNIPEGIITYITATKNIKLGFLLSIAIALHNIPEGISISIPIYYSTKSRKKTFIYVLISALSEPFGAIITHLFLMNLINNVILGIIYSLIAGMMLNISLVELFKNAKKYHKKNAYKYIMLGIIFMLIIHLLLK